MRDSSGKTRIQELQLKNSSITLYPFQLRNDADKEVETLADNALELWKTLQTVGEKFGIDEIKTFTNYLTQPKEEKENPSFLKLLKTENNELSGYKNGFKLTIFPVRFHDTYSADLTISYPGKISVTDLEKLNLEGCFLPELIKSSLGQTLLFYTEPVGTFLEDEDAEKLAKECCDALLQNKIQPQPELIRKGVLFGSRIYEYDNGELEPTKRHHILVLLNCNPKTLEYITKTNFNFDFHRLLLYHHKVLFSYYRSRSWYQYGKEIASKLDAKHSEFKKIDNQTDEAERLKALKNLLAEVRILGFNYSRCLRDISECINTITTNTENYVEILANIQDSQFESDQLQFLTKFAEVSKNKYQGQIKVDLNYLIASQNLFQEMIANIRGMLDIEQIEADREIQKTLIKQITESRHLQESLLNLQKELKNSSDKNAVSSSELNITIGSVGAGIAIAGVVATSYGLVKPEQPLLAPWDQKAHSVHPFIESISWSFLVSGVVVAVVLLGRKIWPLKNKKKTEKNTN